MRYSITGTLLYCAATAYAFQDTSPFLLFSTQRLTPAIQNVNEKLQTASTILEGAKNFLRTCPSDDYFIIHQPEIAASDLSAPGAVPHMRAAISHSNTKGVYTVADVFHENRDICQELQDEIISSCMQDVEDIFEAPNLVGAPMEPLSTNSSARSEQLANLDASFQHNFFQLLSTNRKITFIYCTTPVGSVIDSKEFEPVVYNTKFEATEHIDLKRDFRIRADNTTNGVDTRPLFEKYQFFTPGIFMGLLVGILLLSILAVGLNAVSSLQVSYGAFDKEMGPAAQRKQQ